MTRHRTRWLRAPLALLMPLCLMAAACAGDDDDDGASRPPTTAAATSRATTVTIFGPEVEVEAQGFLDSFAAFEEETGIDVQYQGDRSFEEQIGVRVDGGDPPDIAMFPQPGKIADFADDLVPLTRRRRRDRRARTSTPAGPTSSPSTARSTACRPRPTSRASSGTTRPPSTERRLRGARRPSTDFLALTDQMIADGKTPFCIGIGSDAATGWPFTDWIEDFMLRLKGPDVYDQWVQPRDPVRRPRRGRGRRVRVRPLGAGRLRVRRPAEHRRHAVRRRRPAAARGRLHDAPPGQLLRRQLARGHRDRRGRRRQRLLPARDRRRTRTSR